MRRVMTVLLISLFAVAAQAEPKVPLSQPEITLSFAPVVKATAPAVVNIYAKRVAARRTSPFFNDPFFSDLFRDHARVVPRVENSLGSGVILSPDGIVVSNYHVIRQATEIRVVLNDRREFDAEVLLGDKQADLAILKLKKARDLPALPFRDSDTLEVGELVMAIGNPFGIGQTVSSGIVSGLARSAVSIGSGRGYFIQTDAAINPGNSGGALVDMRGQLVGINTAILTRSGGSNGIGFAIPAKLVQRFVEQAAAGQTKFERPWAGIGGQAVDAALAEGFGLGLPIGVVLTELNADSPFRKAGLDVGDVVTHLNGAEVNTPQEMMFRMSAEGVGGSMTVAYLRNGDEKSANVHLVAPPETPARDLTSVAEDQVLAGLSVVNINPGVVAEYNLTQSAQGVLVVKPGSVAGRVGLRAGDILLRINNASIEDTEDFKKATRRDGRSWSVEYLRGNQRGVLRFRV